MYENVKKIPTDIYGLKYLPSLEPQFSDDKDTVKRFMKYVIKAHKGLPEHKDAKLLTEQFLFIKNKCKCILEIGVGWHKKEDDKSDWNIQIGDEELKNTSTQIFLKLKKKETIYLGIDKANRAYVNKEEEKVYTLQTDSRKITDVMNFLKEKGIFEIDFLFIDGYHSVNMTVNDWQYSKYLSKDGIIMIHDTNVHPGDYVVFDAIDETMFEKKKYFEKDKGSPGMAVIKRKLK